MKKVMLGLVMVVMLMSMVGCGKDTTTSIEKENAIVESEAETEVKIDINGNEIIETETEVNEETRESRDYYGTITKVFQDEFESYIVIKFYRSDNTSFTKNYSYEERFVGCEGCQVKVTGYGNDTYIDEIISVEIVE